MLDDVLQLVNVFMGAGHSDTFASGDALDSSSESAMDWSQSHSLYDPSLYQHGHDLTGVMDYPAVPHQLTVPDQAPDAIHPHGHSELMVGIDHMPHGSDFTSDHIEAAIVHGDPDGAAQFWHMQEVTNSCAVACQTDVLNSFGVHVTEPEVLRMATDLGLYSPSSGTNPLALGNILLMYGIPVTQSFDTSIESIDMALDRGERVLVAVDANEIWTPSIDAQGLPLEQPNAGHAVWVTGIEQDDSGNWNVVLNDTGTPNGRAEHVPIDHFMNAWSDFGYFAATTNVHGGPQHVA